jgi:hypothetical protein
MIFYSNSCFQLWTILGLVTVVGKVERSSVDPAGQPVLGNGQPVLGHGQVNLHAARPIANLRPNRRNYFHKTYLVLNLFVFYTFSPTKHLIFSIRLNAT